MKRSERHHLKENPLARWVSELAETTVAHRGRLTAAAVGVLVIVAAGVGYQYWRSRTVNAADAALARAVALADAPVVPPPAAATPELPAPAPQPGTYPTEQARLEAALPAFLAVADTYPGTRAATVALFHAAATLAEMGRLDEAALRYQQVVQEDRGGIHGQMAELGLANVQLAQGRTEQAIALYQTLSSAPDTRLPVDGVLVQLAQAYAKAGRTDEAAQTYRRVVDEFPQSLYAGDARKALEELDAGRKS